MMDLLKKFENVEVQADNRISEQDKFYCEQHQTAYETAISNFKELAFFWADMEKAQQELLGEKDSSFFHDYLNSRRGLSISLRSIDDHIESLHTDFIANLTAYFNSTHSVSVDPSAILEALLPKQPESRGYYSEEHMRAMKDYHAQLQSLTIRYQDVVDQIILRLGGRSFREQAFYELQIKCHDAAWNTYNQEAKYEQKKDTIRFTGYFCNYREWPFNGWELDDKMKQILYGVAHFETNVYNVLPLGFSDLLGYHDIKESVVEFPTCEKAKQIKLFKNNRVDLKFATAGFAKEFIEKYLGTVC